MTDPIESSSLRLPTRELSPVALKCAIWFRGFARAVKMARLYRGGDNQVVTTMREQVWESLLPQLEASNGWDLVITPHDIRLDDEVVVRGAIRKPGSQEEAIGGPEEKLPFLFYGDGVRGLQFTPKLSRREYDALFDAVVTVGRGRNSQDDLTTLLWQSNLGALHVQTVPPEQQIFLSTRRPRRGRRSFRGQAFAWGVSGADIRADLGQMAGAQGLHRDTFDDWRLPDVHAHPPQAYLAILPNVEASKTRLKEAFEQEIAVPWTSLAPRFIRLVVGISPDVDTRWAFCHSVVTWLAASLQEGAWDHAEEAVTLLHELDPRRVVVTDALTERLADLDTEPLAELLDEDEAQEQGRFSALMVHIGRPAIPLTGELMSLCTRQRARAACVTALSYLAADNPGDLQPLLDDPRWYVVRNAVFVLGQIGGSEVLDLLRRAALHPEPRVRREVVRALGGLSRAERTPLLILQLRSDDPQLVAAALGLLTRETNPRVTKAILERIEAPDFEGLPVHLQRAFLMALAEVADERLIPALELLLTKNPGWFAMRTLTRDWAARILKKIGNEQAMRILDLGLRSKTEAIRLACLDAMGEGRSAA
jgi:HEAT repeat protein